MESAEKQGESLEPKDEESKPAEPGEVAEESLEAGAEPAGSSEAPTEAANGTNPENASAKSPSKPPKAPGPLGRLKILNIYFLLFLLAVLVGVMVLIISLQMARKESGQTSLDTQTLSPEDINNISGNDVSIGEPDQILRVKSNAVFEERLLVQGNVDIAGSLKVNSTFSVTELNVTNTGSINDARIGQLAVTGNASIQGQLTVQGTLNLTGGAAFGGAINAPQATIQTLQLNNDLKLNGHIDAGGPSPGKTNGALGGGGTASVSGSDTAGSISINTGSGPGTCLVTINFARAFGSTPHVVISPTSSDGANLNYYVQRTANTFTICGTNTASARTYNFDYIVID